MTLTSFRALLWIIILIRIDLLFFYFSYLIFFNHKTNKSKPYCYLCLSNLIGFYDILNLSKHYSYFNLERLAYNRNIKGYLKKYYWLYPMRQAYLN